MATITGQSLVDAIQASTGVTLNPLLQATLAARLQQQLDTGTYSPLAAAVAIQGFSTEIKAVVDANGGSTAFSTHLTEVAAAIQNDTPVPEFVPEADQTFALTAGAAAVDEGATATFTLTTTGVAEGTAVAYTLSGIDAADLASGALTGNAVVGADGTATISVVLAADGATEGAETLTVTLDGKTVSATTTVNDTSVLGQTFMLTASAASINEGETNTFTVTASKAVTEATTITFQLKVDAAGDTAQAADFNAGAFNPVTVTIPAGQTSASFGLATITNDGTEVTEKYTVQATVGGQVLTTQVSILDGAIGAGQTFMLTKAQDMIPGLNGSNGNTSNSGDDTIIGSVDSTNAELNTLSNLDLINGGTGIDTLKVSTNNATAVPLAAVSNVEIIEIQGANAGGTVVNTSAVNGVTNLNVTKTAGLVSATAGATTDVKVDLAQGTATSNASLTADVLADIAVNGGKDVTVNVTGVKQVLDTADNAATELNAITVGGTTAAAGTVTVTSTGAKTAANADAILSSIAVKGGTSVSVTQKATSDAAAAATDTKGTTITQGDVTVTGDASTTTVTVKQDASADERLAATAVAAKASTQELTFGAMTKDQTVSVDFGDGKLIFTANKALTAAEAASAFANLAAGAKQGNASAALGIYTDVVDAGSAGGVTNGWTSGAVTTVSDTAAKVTFTSATAAAAITDGTGTKPITVGAYSGNAVAAGAAKTGVLGVANGKVSVVDSNGAIKTITVDGYANSSTTTTTVLETLNLSNSALQYEGTANGQVQNAGTAASFTVADTAATLALNLEKVGYSGYYDGDAAVTTQTAAVTLSDAPTTLNVKSTGNNYVALTDSKDQITTLSVSGTGLFDASTNDLKSLKTIKVTETAGLKLNAAVSNTVESVDTTGTTGTVTVAIKGAQATYTGGAGVDNVTVDDANVAIAKAIDLGAGNDTLTLTGGTILTPTVDLKGGDGVDTLVLAADQAADNALTASAAFAGKIDGFEKLSVGAVAAGSDITVNLANIDNISNVISAGTSVAGLGTTETTDVTFNALKSGQSVTVAGRVVTATGGDVSANEVEAAYLAGATNGKAVVTGTLSTDWTVAEDAGGAANAKLSFKATTAGDVANLSTLSKTDNVATAPTVPTAVASDGKAAGVETTVMTFSSLLPGEQTVVSDPNSGKAITVTAKNASAETAVFDLETAINSMEATANDTFVLNGITLTVKSVDSGGTSGIEEDLAQAFVAASNGSVGDYTAGGGNVITISGSLNAAGQEYKWTHDTKGVLTATSLLKVDATTLTDAVWTDADNGLGSKATNVTPTVTAGVSGTLKANEVAALVADLVDGTLASANANANATTTGAFTGWTGTASTNTVTFNATAGDVKDLTVANSGSITSQTQGTKAVDETTVVTFQSLLSGQSVTVGALKMTALADLTADEVATAFASVNANATPIDTVKYDYDDTTKLTSWSSGVATKNAVTFTSATAGTDVAAITLAAVKAADPTLPTFANTDGGVGGVKGGTLTLDKMANNGTLELTGAAATTTVKMLDATGTTDTFNIVTSAINGTNVGTVVVAKVETLNVTANDMDTTTTVNATTGAVTGNVSTNTLALNADAAKTVNLTGAGNLTLTLGADSKAVTLIDGSTATGKLNVTTLASDTAATTVKGGSAADTLVAQGANDVLLGGAGNDVLKVVGGIASAVTLTGDAGVDQFDVSGFTAANAGAAATITDLVKGETIKFVSNANANFASSKVVLIDQATFDNYVTEAAKAASAADNGSHGLAWFQFGGDTFIVQDIVGNSAFDNGVDIIVKITGAVDLSASSFNEVGQGTLLFI